MNLGKRRVVVRIILSLIILVSTLSVVIANGCGTTSVPVEEGKTMTENIIPMTGNNTTGNYRTATFALG